MSKDTVSLCITYPSINDSTKKVTFRVADVVDDCLVQAKYSTYIETNLNGIYYPRNIGTRPGEAIENRAEIRKWWFYATDTKYPSSSRCNDLFYEIVFPSEFCELDLSKQNVIREIIKDGFELFDGVSDNLLIVIGYEDDYFIALECHKKDWVKNNGSFKISPNISDMLHVPHYFNLRYIHKDDLISTENVGIFTAEGTKVQDRYFYKYLNFEEADEKFYLRDFVDYLPIYLSRYVKQQKEKIQFSNSDIKKIITIVEEALKEENDLIEFFETTGYTFDFVKEQIAVCSKYIVDAFLSNNETTQIIERHLYNSEDLYSRCIEIVRQKWLSEKDEERDNIIKKIDEKYRELQELNDNINLSKSIQKSLEEKYDTLNEAIKNLIIKQQNIEAQIRSEVRGFEANLISYIANDTFSRSFDKSKMDSILIPERLILTKGQACGDINKIEIINNPYDLISDLSENLQFIGISSEFSLELAQIVFAAVCMNIGFIASGCYAREFADAVSALISAQSCDILTLPTGYRNLGELIHNIKSSESKVILIENALDCVTETLCISALKQCPDKILIFSIEDQENISMFSKGIWNYLLLVDLDFMFKVPMYEDLLLAKTDSIILGFSNKDMQLQPELKRLAPLLTNLKLPKSTSIKLAQLVCVYKKIAKAEGLNTIILLELLSLYKSSEKIEQILIVGQDVLNSRQKELLNSLLQEELVYE